MHDAPSLTFLGYTKLITVEEQFRNMPGEKLEV